MQQLPEKAYVNDSRRTNYLKMLPSSTQLIFNEKETTLKANKNLSSLDGKATD